MTKKESVESKNIRFEDALKRLEKIVEKLEAGDAPLEESLALYEEGISLFRQCSGKLEEAKKKVEILTKKGAGGKLEAQPFNPGKEYPEETAEEADETSGENTKEELPF